MARLRHICGKFAARTVRDLLASEGGRRAGAGQLEPPHSRASSRFSPPTDYKGLKMRISGLGGKVIAKAGSTAVIIPSDQIYASLERAWSRPRNGSGRTKT